MPRLFAVRQYQTLFAMVQVWDSLGRLLYQSAPLQSSITALAWSPTSEAFAVGCYNSLLLCHASGWLYSKVCVALPSMARLDTIQFVCPCLLDAIDFGCRLDDLAFCCAYL